MIEILLWSLALIQRSISASSWSPLFSVFNSKNQQREKSKIEVYHHQPGGEKKNLPPWQDSCQTLSKHLRFWMLPVLVVACTRLQAEFGLRPAIRSLWWGFKPSVSKLCRAGQRHCSTRRPRDGFMALSPDKAWGEHGGEGNGIGWVKRFAAIEKDVWKEMLKRKRREICNSWTSVWRKYLLMKFNKYYLVSFPAYPNKSPEHFRLGDFSLGNHAEIVKVSHFPIQSVCFTLYLLSSNVVVKKNFCHPFQTL